ncbi:DNA-protecting protein DprA [Candidatus Microgenomates bacterium]|nr:MAG: DNA-protecting protein DprA [Candidatus Microgenomates bacterium]
MKISDFPIFEITPSSPNWPMLLNKLPDPPKKLFFRGKWDNSLFEKSLAIVGSRRMTNYGERVLEMLIPSLVAEKTAIISGFMYGVDTKAHQECLECGGRTIAVLGGGLNVLYPPENESLYIKTLRGNGLIVSEYPSEQKPQLWTFVQRNRLVAGLSSLGVLVIEAGEKSGSLVTANIALKLKRAVYAIPGPINASTSKGTNMLIKQNLAKIVLSTGDVVESDLTKRSSKKEPTGLTTEELKIIELLSAEAMTLDELALKIGKNIIETGQALTLMSLKGLVEENGGKYCLKNDLL